MNNSSCCVHNCPTYKDPNLKPTFFMLPVDPTMKQKWLSSLNNLIHPNTQILNVCELHFQPEDVLRVEYTCVEGKLEKLDKMTSAIRKNAVPCFFKEPYPNMQNLTRKEDSPAVMQRAYSYTLLNGTDSLLLYPDSGNILNDKVLKVDNGNSNNNTISSSTDVTMGNEADTPPILHTLKNMSQSQEIQLMAGDGKQIINIKDFPLNLTGPVALRIKPVTDKVGETTLEDVKIVPLPVVKPFTFFDLKSHLDQRKEMRIQSQWRYLGEAKSILFFFIESPERGIAKTVYVNENLKMEVRVANQLVKVQEPPAVRNINDVCRFLSQIGDMRVCDKMYGSETCDSTKGCAKLFPAKRNAINSLHCNECSNLKKRRSEIAKESLSRSVLLLAKKQRQQRSMQDLRSYCGHLKRKLSLMSKQMQEMVNHYSSVKKLEIEKELSFLPPRQMEVVKTFFSSIRRQPGNRKFSKQWIQECSLLYNESSKVYKYLRTKELLPLPAVDTLRAYNKKLASPVVKTEVPKVVNSVTVQLNPVKPDLNGDSDESMETINLTNEEDSQGS